MTKVFPMRPRRAALAMLSAAADRGGDSRGDDQAGAEAAGRGAGKVTEADAAAQDRRLCHRRHPTRVPSPLCATCTPLSAHMGVRARPDRAAMAPGAHRRDDQRATRPRRSREGRCHCDRGTGRIGLGEAGRATDYGRGRAAQRRRALDRRRMARRRLRPSVEVRVEAFASQ